VAEREIPQPTEQVYLPSPSWGPIFLAFGAALALSGIFANGFIVRGWVYSLIGLVVVIVALIGITGNTTRNFARLPRRQRVRGAVIPAAPLRSTRRP
jgi:uncharacterized membrane protein